MKELINYIIKKILDKEDFTIEEENEGDLKTFKVTLAKNDIGLIIGKGGKIINAIKNLVKLKAIKENVKVDIKLLEKD